MRPRCAVVSPFTVCLVRRGSVSDQHVMWWLCGDKGGGAGGQCAALGERGGGVYEDRPELCDAVLSFAALCQMLERRLTLPPSVWPVDPRHTQLCGRDAAKGDRPAAKQETAARARVQAAFGGARAAGCGTSA
eukprot:COSAG02_NODE_101_length_36804_cov_125.342951_27_plen_133_part_00